MRTLSTERLNDAQLVELSRDGDCEAFGRIVERYQSLVCALTYSACGNLQTSEDLAQVTFITAWCQLRNLREPAKLKSWLCRIARNATVDSFRQQQRTPTANAAALDATADVPSEPVTPRDHVISQEEEAILWRSLSELPPTYREPLVLFYRQQRSVAEVAHSLDVSEDVARQRLSRGRVLLAEKMSKFVEEALTRTAPGQQFSLGVMAMLPMAATATASAAAGAGIAAKGTAAAKSGFLAACVAPFVGIFGGIAAQWLVVRAAPTERERRVSKIAFTSLWIFVLAWCFIGQLVMRTLSRHFEWTHQTYFAAMAGFWWFYAVVCATLTIVMFRRLLVIRRQSEATGERTLPAVARWTPGTRAAVSVGTYMACFLWLISLAWQLNDRVVAGILAGLMVGLAGWDYFSLRGKIGLAVMQAVARHLTAAWAIILVVLNLRLDTWIATAHRSTLAEVHDLLPPWVIPVLTLALLLWSGLVLAITKPTRRL